MERKTKLQLHFIIAAGLFFSDICLAITAGTVNQGTYRPPHFRRRARRSALFHETFTTAPVPPLKTCPCSTKPCQHFGDCTNSREFSNGNLVYEFRCSCSGEWRGETCNKCDVTKKMTLCEDSCLGFLNNGACNDGGPGHVTADCTLGTDCSDCSVRCVRRAQDSTTKNPSSEEVTPEPNSEPTPEPNSEPTPEPNGESEGESSV